MRTVVASVAIAAAAFLIPASAAAECLPVPAIPPATEAAPSAQELFVGTVLENVGLQIYDFRVRIDRVYRGPAQVGDIRRFKSVKTGWPLIDVYDGTKVPPCTEISASPGDVIAFALKATAPDGKTIYNAASWISGAPLLYEDPLPRTTLDEFEAVTLPRTDAARTVDVAESQTRVVNWSLVIAATLVGAVIVGRRSRDTPRP